MNVNVNLGVPGCNHVLDTSDFFFQRDNSFLQLGEALRSHASEKRFSCYGSI
jgi:hypothetical protein